MALRIDEEGSEYKISGRLTVENTKDINEFNAGLEKAKQIIKKNMR